MWPKKRAKGPYVWLSWQVLVLAHQVAFLILGLLSQISRPELPTPGILSCEEMPNQILRSTMDK